MRYFGKSRLYIAKANDKWIEGQFEWSKILGFEEDDGELMLSFLIIWRHIPWDKLTDKTLWDTVTTQLDAICLKWLKIENSFTELPSVHHHSVYMLAALITKIWNDGFNVACLRQYKLVIIKAAKDIEMASNHGYRKHVQVQLSLGHRTIRDGLLLRKIPTKVIIVNVYCLTRADASLADMTEMVSIQKQGAELIKARSHSILLLYGILIL